MKKKGEWCAHVTASLPLWTCQAVHHLPSGGSTGSWIYNNVGQTGGFGWHLLGGGPAPRHTQALRIPAWWNGCGGGSRTAGSGGRLSAYWLEGCSAAGWPPTSQWNRWKLLQEGDLFLLLFCAVIKPPWGDLVSSPFLSGRCSPAVVDALMSGLWDSWCFSDVLCRSGINHQPEIRRYFES